MGSNTTRVTQEITGRETVLLGERCVAEHRRRSIRLLLVGLMIASVLAVGVPLIVFLFFASEEWAPLVAGLAGPGALLGALVLGLGLYFETKKEQAEFGEDLGIRLRKAYLKKQGAGAFWTQKDREAQVESAAQRR